uniref:Uncharacterized protein n=1 Tax=Ditylenchus dipsaci TaxID=166011 RepID=A0A915EX32_9BILA
MKALEHLNSIDRSKDKNVVKNVPSITNLNAPIKDLLFGGDTLGLTNRWIRHLQLIALKVVEAAGSKDKEFNTDNEGISFDYGSIMLYTGYRPKVMLLK